MDVQINLSELRSDGIALLDASSSNLFQAERFEELIQSVLGHFSTPVVHCGQPQVMHVRPTPSSQPASYKGTGRFDLHTDCSWHPNPARILAMLCIAVDESGGGIPLVSDGYQAARMLSADQISELEKAKINFPSPEHVNLPLVSTVVLRPLDEFWHVRFRRDLLTAAGSKALSAFSSAVDECCKEIQPYPGLIYVIDNWRMLHGRTEILGGESSMRHFLRMYGDWK